MATNQPQPAVSLLFNTSASTATSTSTTDPIALREVDGYARTGRRFLLGAHGHLATEAPAFAVAAPLSDTLLSLRGRVVVGAGFGVGVGVGGSGGGFNGNSASASVVSLVVALYSGVEPQPPSKVAALDNNLDPLDAAATAPLLHVTPLVSQRVRLVHYKKPVKLSADSDSLFDFNIPLPNTLPQTVILPELDQTTGKAYLAGSSTFVFVVIKISSSAGIETVISGREAIIQKLSLTPPLEKMIPVSVKYHVREITATISLTKYHNILPPIPDANGNLPPADYITLRITNWNPLLRLLRASCEWTETIKTAIPHPPTSESDEHSTSKPQSFSVERRSRTIGYSHVDISEIASPQLGGFQHDFPLPQFVDLQPTVNGHIIVEHCVNVAITFCRGDVLDADMAISFRPVYPKLGYYVDTLVPGPFSPIIVEAKGDEVPEPSKKWFGGLFGTAERGSARTSSSEQPPAVQSVITQSQGPSSAWSANSVGRSLFGAFRSAPDVSGSSNRETASLPPASNTGTTFAQTRTTGASSLPALNASAPMSSSESSTTAQPRKFGVIGVKRDENAPNIFNSPPIAANEISQPTSEPTAPRTGFGVLNVRRADEAPSHIKGPQLPAASAPVVSTGSGFKVLNVRAVNPSTSPTQTPSFFANISQKPAAASASSSVPTQQPQTLAPATKSGFGILRVQRDESTGFFQPSTVASFDPSLSLQGPTPSRNSFDPNSTTSSSIRLFPTGHRFDTDDDGSSTVSPVRNRTSIGSLGSLVQERSVRIQQLNTKDFSGMDTTEADSPLEGIITRLPTLMNLDQSHREVNSGNETNEAEKQLQEQIVALLNKTFECIEVAKRERHDNYPFLKNHDDIGQDAERGLVWGKNHRTEQNGFLLPSKLNTSAPITLSKHKSSIRTTASQATVSTSHSIGRKDTLSDIPIDVLRESEYLAALQESILLSQKQQAHAEEDEAVAVAPNAGGSSSSGAGPSNQNIGSSSTAGGPSSSSRPNQILETAKPKILTLYRGLDVKASDDAGDRIETALHDHLVLGTSSDLLHVQKGDRVSFNVNFRDGEFVYGKNERTGKEGMFPVGVLGPLYGGLEAL
ncbi:hypothetical protein HDU79_002809 [Rhizoclosmatium sp. JEL0117]|nr:hypothetical protein HDU79_002809 [Rhizoclosmatium sp. JEL0117]